MLEPSFVALVRGSTAGAAALGARPPAALPGNKDKLVTKDGSDNTALARHYGEESAGANVVECRRALARFRSSRQGLTGGGARDLSMAWARACGNGAGAQVVGLTARIAGRGLGVGARPPARQHQPWQRLAGAPFRQQTSALTHLAHMPRPQVGRNVIHGSDSVESATREIGLWFPEGVAQWTPVAKPWIYE